MYFQYACTTKLDPLTPKKKKNYATIGTCLHSLFENTPRPILNKNFKKTKILPMDS